MIYSAHIVTDEQGSVTELKQTILKVTKGLIYKIELYFPWGSAGLMGAAIFDGHYSIWPSIPGHFFTGSDVRIDFDDLYLKETAPYELQVYTYNEDDIYKHAVDIRVGLVSKEIYKARFLPTVAWEKYREMLMEVETQQKGQTEAQRQEIIARGFDWLGPV